MRSAVTMAGLLALLWASAAAAAPPAKERVVFIGSSTIEFWRERLADDFPDYDVVGLGQGGTTYEFVLANARAWAKQYPAPKYVIYSGDNDIHGNGKTAEAVDKDFQKTVDLIKKELPKVEIYVISIKGRKTPGAEKVGKTVREANELLSKSARANANVTFVDTYSLTHNPDGTPRLYPNPELRGPPQDLFREDGIHLTDYGYEIWARELASKLKKKQPQPSANLGSAAASSDSANTGGVSAGY